ncbi:hypothetical protein [Roseateles sp. P5_E4]
MTFASPVKWSPPRFPGSAMSLRSLAIATILLAALGLVWQKQEQLQAWLGAARASSTSAPSLGEPLVAARPAADAATSTSARSRPAGLRKCVKGQQVSYTNVECPPGHQELAVTAAPVNVLPATPVSKPAESSSGPSSLHKALDLTRDDTLRERAIERAVNGNR